MSNSDIRVVPGPANYFSHPGSLERLSDFFNADQLSRAVWVYGERALAGAEPFLPAAFHLPEAKKIRFTGHCSERDVAGLVQASGDDRAVVIGVGGGALLDSSKVLARRLGVPLVAIPTIAATCAAWTPLSVWYSDAGQALNFELFDDANFLVLVEPQIPQNTGNISRTCAATGARLHLVGPMGFTVDDKKLKRAGLDYWHLLDITYYEGLTDFFARNEGPFYYFTTKAPQRYTDVAYPDGAYLVFGREDAGLPEALLVENQEACVRLPMIPDARSLNLSNTVAVGVYEALRQRDFAGLLDTGRLRGYEWK